jgi:hypothetical protein
VTLREATLKELNGLLDIYRPLAHDDGLAIGCHPKVATEVMAALILAQIKVAWLQDPELDGEVTDVDIRI